MEPTPKSPAANAFLSKVMGKDREETIRASECMTCERKHVGTTLHPFKDGLSKKEYTISGMCQACQDKVFG